DDSLAVCKSNRSSALITPYSKEPNYPAAHPIIDAEASASAHEKIGRGGDKDQVVAKSHFVRMIRLPVKSAKVVLRSVIFDRCLYHRHHRRQHFEPVTMKPISRDLDNDAHTRANLCCDE